jgi:fructan beta-fructosidase
MAVYDELNNGRYIAFYTSSDLKNWNFESRIEGFYECPDLFELPVIGADHKKWVLTAAGSEYRVGTFDGRVFTPETPMLPGHRGNSFYAAQTYSDIPDRDGRRVQIGWGRMATPGMPFNQMMCFPTAMTLRQTSDGPRLAWEPVEEIKKLRKREQRWKTQEFAPGIVWTAGNAGELIDAEFELESENAEAFELTIRGVPLTYDVSRQELASLDRKTSAPLRDGKLRVRLLADRTSLEIFADNGLVYMPMSWKPQPASRSISAQVRGGRGKLNRISLYELESIWTNP